MKNKLNITQLLRHLIQLGAFIFFPGMFLSTFNALRDVVTALVTGSFTFAGLASQLILLLIVFSVTVLWGRLFCGYLCSFGAVQELMGWISKKTAPRMKRVPEKVDRRLKTAKYAVLALIVLLVWILQLPVDSTLSPWGVFGMLISGNLSIMGMAVPTVGFILLTVILVGSFFVERFFCRYLCPLGALFTLSSGHRLYRIRRKESICIGCANCSRSCAMGLSVHDSDSVSSGECIDCLRCVRVCHPAALHSEPHSAVAGTAAALMLSGLVYAGSITSEKIEAPTVGTASAADSAYTTLLKGGTASGQTAGSYVDGVYTGTGTGFRGDVQVQVTVSGGTISDITVISSKDDRQYFNKASSGVISAILSKQSTDVDVVSGATFSSRGILEAVADALNIEFVNENSGLPQSNNGNRPGRGNSVETERGQNNAGQNTAPGPEQYQMRSGRGKHRGGSSSAEQSAAPSGGTELTPAVPETPTQNETEAAEPENPAQSVREAVSGLSDGEYTGSGSGLRGSTQVSVTVEGGKIANVTVTSYDDDREYFSRAQNGVISAILNSQSLDVDTVSGATFSSNSILEAVADALDLEYTNPNDTLSRRHGGHGRF